jgi:5'-methylthioadenosine phosphorylase
LTNFAVIGGSDAHRVLEKDYPGEELGERDTPFGRSEPVRLVSTDKGGFMFLARHGRKGYEKSAPFVNYRANIYALKDLGAEFILSWSGPGAINTDFKPGTFAIPDDLIDETRGRKSTFFENKGIGFVRHNPVFCPTLREVIKNALSAEGVAFSAAATYVVTEGPRLETPAEIKKYRMFGADLVGMTLAPEVFLAKELELHYAALCYISNVAEGLTDRKFKSGVLFEGLADKNELSAAKAAVNRISSIIRRVQGKLPETAQICQCDALMERYRKSGIIGRDFREYLL